MNNMEKVAKAMNQLIGVKVRVEKLEKYKAGKNAVQVNMLVAEADENGETRDQEYVFMYGRVKPGKRGYVKKDVVVNDMRELLEKKGRVDAVQILDDAKIGEI